MRVIVIGGGISGLACAHFLGKAGHETRLVEPRALGGALGSVKRDGFLCEVGPQALVASSPAVQTLIDDLGLRARALTPQPAAKRRLLFSRGRLHTVPMSPPTLLTTSLLSWRGRWRLLAEPFMRRRKEDEAAQPESLRDFAVRRLGLEATDRMLAPAVMAVYAGDVRTLEAKSAFPSLVTWEREHGSLFRGALNAARKNKGAPRGIVSFPDGLQEIVEAIATRLGSNRVNGRALSVEPVQGGWNVVVASPEGGDERALEAEAVVLACDRTAAAALLDSLAPAASRALREIPVAPAAVVHLGFRAAPSALGVDLGAYGFIAARDEGVHLLGCQYESSIFASRAPEGQTLLRAIVGGTFDRGAVEMPDEALVSRTLGDLVRVLGLRATPDFTAVWRHPQGIPQYTLGHAARCAAIAEDVRRRPGLFIMGNALRGVGVADCITQGEALAREVATGAALATA